MATDDHGYSDVDRTSGELEFVLLLDDWACESDGPMCAP
jgi:hypothetical protein